MKLRRRLENWMQVCGAIMLADAVLFAVLLAIRPGWQLLGFGLFSLWIGWRLRVEGCRRAARSS